MRLAFSLLVLFLGVALCAVDNIEAEEHVQLHSFEGYYDVGGLPAYVCQDGTKISASLGENGIFIGGITSDDGTVATGSTWFPGQGPCVSGTGTLTLLDYGFLASGICNDGVTPNVILATRINSYRPTDDQCAILAESGTVQGRWVNTENQLEADICFIDSNSADYTAYGSLQRVDPDGNILSWYVEGHWVNGGKIFQGTWYQDYSAGAIMFFLKRNGDLAFYSFTGLLYDQGQTYTDPSQYFDPYLHASVTYQVPVGLPSDHDSSGALCRTYQGLKPYVLNNLPRGESNYYYYFIDTDYLDVDNIRYFRPYETPDSASSLSFCFVVFVVSLLVAMF